MAPRQRSDGAEKMQVFVPKELAQLIREEAKANFRSVTGQFEHVFRYWVGTKSSGSQNSSDQGKR